MTDAQYKRVIARLLKRLEPFAREADTWAGHISDSYRPGVTEPRQRYSHAKAEFSLGDLRRAKAEVDRARAEAVKEK
jgi:hypothetical protein